MRILHTSDWHVGKRLGRYDRTAEFGEAIDRVVGIAEGEGVDLVVVSGDLFDRPQPPVESLRLVLEGLARLATAGPVVAVAGNHDSPDLFEALAPFTAPLGIHLVGHIKPPREGGVLEVETPAGPALVACFPFLREGRVVDFMADTGRWYGQYADRVRAICDAYGDHLTAAGGAERVLLLVAHFMVTGARVGGHGAPRGERPLHIGEAYSATEEALPRSLGYVAMGHIHAPQPVPGANVPAQYAGSLLPLDFGEAGEEKRVVIVDAEPGRPASVRSVPLGVGRPLIRAEGTWEELAGRTDLADAYLDLTVHTDGPDPGLADRAREAFSHLVRVRAHYERPEEERESREGRTLSELYGEYHEAEYGSPPPPELADAFADVMDEVLGASA